MARTVRTSGWLRPMLAAAALIGSVLAPGERAAAQQPVDKTILMVLWRIETEYDLAFQARIAETGAKIRPVKLFGEGSRDVLASRLRDLHADFIAGRFDAVYSWGTTATELVTAVTGGRVPVVFNVVFDPVESRLVASEEKPGGSVTGVSNGVAIDRQFDAFQTLFSIRLLCLLFNARERNANLVLEDVTAWAAKQGVQLNALRAAPGTPLLAEHLARIKSGQTQCDAVYAGAGSYLGSQAAEIRTAIGNTVKLLAGTERFVSFGWLAAYAPRVEDMGRAAADLTMTVLSGEAPGSLPVVKPPPSLFVSQEAAAQHGIAVPPTAIRKTAAGGS